MGAVRSLRAAGRCSARSGARSRVCRFASHARPTSPLGQLRSLCAALMLPRSPHSALLPCGRAPAPSLRSAPFYLLRCSSVPLRPFRGVAVRALAEKRQWRARPPRFRSVWPQLQTHGPLRSSVTARAPGKLKGWRGPNPLSYSLPLCSGHVHSRPNACIDKK